MIYVVRHGESTLNAKGVKYGDLDPELTDRGFQQALEVAEMAWGDHFHVYASPALRAWQTASVIATVVGTTPVVVHELRERSFGEAEGLTKAEIQRRWGSDPIPGMESVESAGARAREFLDTLEGDCIVVTHAGVMKGLFGLDSSPRNGQVMAWSR